MSYVAIPWFVLETTGSATRMGLVGFANTVPLVFTAFFGSAFVNRVGFKRTSVIADVASGITIALIPLLHHTVGLAFWQLMALVFLGAVLDAPGDVARQSLFPDLAEIGAVRLERANAFAAASWRLSRMLGPALAGVLIAVIGASNVLWLDGASFAASALLVAALVPTVTPVDLPEARPGYLTEVLDGLRIVRRDRLITVFAVIGTLGNAFGAAVMAIGLPLYANDVLGGAKALGLMLAAFDVGALAGVGLFGVVAVRVSRTTLFRGSLVAGIFPYWMLAATPMLPGAIAAQVFQGLTSGPFGPIVRTVFQERVPAAQRASFFGTMLALDNITTPLALLLAGVAFARYDFASVMVAIACANLVVSLFAVLHPSTRKLPVPRGAMPT